MPKSFDSNDEPLGSPAHLRPRGRQRSFSGAAKRLDVSKSLVSRKTSQLESHLGTRLQFRTTVAAAVEGLGFCRLPHLYVRAHLKAGRLISIFDRYQYDVFPVWLVYPNTRYVSAKVRMFIDYLCENIGPLTGRSNGAQDAAMHKRGAADTYR